MCSPFWNGTFLHVRRFSINLQVKILEELKVKQINMPVSMVFSCHYDGITREIILLSVFCLSHCEKLLFRSILILTKYKSQLERCNLRAKGRSVIN